ncbi:MAG TPA: nucleotidyl transferase AbiEii/AbiGii toxin family protein [Thermoanaerobaculia bacterium]|nr:nucleotidyl transferase AbiEii/AbiGii toxin family protein [Thermoanaerobaculia bacterium]
MNSLQFWKAVTMDRSDFLEGFLSVLETLGVDFCVVGGVAVNAYSEPIVTEDFDVAVVMADLPRVEKALAEKFEVRRFPHSLNVSSPDSKLRLQIQTDPRYGAFVGRARIREVMDLQLPVAAPEDLLQGKIWAVQDEGRRRTKRLKDLTDISRLIDAYPDLSERVPPDILARINS